MKWLAALFVAFLCFPAVAHDLYKPSGGCATFMDIDTKALAAGISLQQMTPQQTQRVVDAVYQASQSAIIVDKLYYAVTETAYLLFGFIDGCYTGNGKVPAPIIQPLLEGKS